MADAEHPAAWAVRSDAELGDATAAEIGERAALETALGVVRATL